MAENIYFFNPQDSEYGFLSNFYRAPFTLDEEAPFPCSYPTKWETVEHYFQAHKFTDKEYAVKIVSAATPAEAKLLGQTRQYPLRADWDEVKIAVMTKAVAAKFCLHNDGGVLAKKLLATRKKKLIEASPTDYFWGEGADGSGQNQMGKILMAVREVLPHCEHEYLQGLQDDEALPDFDSDAGICAELHRPHLIHQEFNVLARIVRAVKKLLAQPDWDPSYSPPGVQVNVLRHSLFGHSEKFLAKVFQPWFDVKIKQCFQPDYDPEVVLMADQPENTPWQKPEAELAVGLSVCSRLNTRVGEIKIRTIQTQLAFSDWNDDDKPVYSTQWKDLLSSQHRSLNIPEDIAQQVDYWTLESVWSIPTDNREDIIPMLYYATASKALALHLLPHHKNGEAFYQHSRFIAIFVEKDEDFMPGVISQANLAGVLALSSPYGDYWKPIAIAKRRGGLPLIQKAFAKSFSHWGFELPTEAIILRAPCGNFDDFYSDGVSGWSICYAFGKDEMDGEYLDVDSCHRMCGEDFVRYFENGKIIKRRKPINEKRMNHHEALTAIETESNESIRQRKMRYLAYTRYFQDFTDLKMDHSDHHEGLPPLIAESKSSEPKHARETDIQKNTQLPPKNFFLKNIEITGFLGFAVILCIIAAFNRPPTVTIYEMLPNLLTGFVLFVVGVPMVFGLLWGLWRVLWLIIEIGVRWSLLPVSWLINIAKFKPQSNSLLGETVKHEDAQKSLAIHSHINETPPNLTANEAHKTGLPPEVQPMPEEKPLKIVSAHFSGAEHLMDYIKDINNPEKRFPQASPYHGKIEGRKLLRINSSQVYGINYLPNSARFFLVGIRGRSSR